MKVCLNCGRPEKCDYTEKEVFLNGEQVGVSKWCAHRADLHQKAEEEFRSMKKFVERPRMVVDDVIPGRHLAHLDRPDPERGPHPTIVEISQNWEDYKSRNIYMFGKSTAGKSFDMAWLLTKIRDKFRPSDDFAWTTVRSMVDSIVNDKNDADFYKECRVLVIEDIQLVVNTKGDQGMLFDILSERVDRWADHPTWFTSNITPEKISENLPTALFNRIFQIEDAGSVLTNRTGRAVEIFKEAKR